MLGDPPHRAATGKRKGDVMNKANKPMNKPSKPITSDKQRGIGVVELLFAATTLGAAVLVAAMSGAKRPPEFVADDDSVKPAIGCAPAGIGFVQHCLRL
jgi:hypothetical protein